jgi:hypothetical protein
MFKPGVLRPSRVLGLLLFAVVGSFYGFVQWQRGLADNDSRLLLAPQWVFVMGAFTAMVGWMVGSLVTVRNSVKQHTINTLLQPRLSLAYVDRLKKVNDAYSPLGGPNKPVAVADLTDPSHADALNAMRYFLNYSEFIALAIRHGDLDETLMCASLSGVVRTQFSVAAVLVEKASNADKRNFEHLRWLNGRWSSKLDMQIIEDLCVLAVGLLISYAAGFASNAALSYLTTPLRLPPAPPAITGRPLGAPPAASEPQRGPSSPKKAAST